MRIVCLAFACFFFKQKTAYEMRISDWSSDVCSADLFERDLQPDGPRRRVEEKLAGLVQKERRCRIHIVENVPCEEVHRNMVVERREPDIAIDDRVAVIRERAEEEIGRASCRERVCKYG